MISFKARTNMQKDPISAFNHLTAVYGADGPRLFSKCPVIRWKAKNHK